MSRPSFCSSPWLRFPLAAAATFAISSCGSDETTPAASGGGTTTGDASSTADGNGSVAIGAVDKLALSVAVKHLDQQLALQGAVLKPQACTDKAPCPLMVVVGDYDANAYPEYVPGLTKLAGALKIGVVVFNLPGMGPGSNKSEGIDEYGSGAQAAAVKEVMLLKSAASWVDKSRCGFLTIGTGLIATTKALATYGNSDALKNTLFLLDVEGPLDRCSISQAPANEADGIVSDGPGATDSTCHFSKTGTHAVTYPPATGSLPASIVCSPAAWPITKTAKGCDENSWWVDREPYNYLKKAFYRYQRIQFEHDHRLPSKWASRLAIQALASSPSKFWQLNNMQACNAAWSDEECVGMPCWIQGSWGNGLGPSPYAAGKLVKITNEALFTQVLPGYVQRLIDVQANPPCK